MSLSSSLYNAIFKRSSTFFLACVGATFVFERTFDLGADYIYDTINQGKLWKDIKHNYES